MSSTLADTGALDRFLQGSRNAEIGVCFVCSARSLVADLQVLQRLRGWALYVCSIAVQRIEFATYRRVLCLFALACPYSHKAPCRIL